MKTYLFLFITTMILTSCNQESGTVRSENKSEQKIRQQVIAIAANYANSKFKDAKKTIENDGSIIFSAAGTKCLIDPSNIIIGEIDEDSYKDGVVTIFTFLDRGLPLKEHLIMINKNGKLSISKEMDGEMKFLSISDRTIVIETSKIAPDSPFADCQICKEIKKYKFIAGDTVRIK